MNRANTKVINKTTRMNTEEKSIGSGTLVEALLVPVLINVS